MTKIPLSGPLSAVAVGESELMTSHAVSTSTVTMSTYRSCGTAMTSNAVEHPHGWDDRFHVCLSSVKNEVLHLHDREFFDTPKEFDEQTQSRILVMSPTTVDAVLRSSSRCAVASLQRIGPACNDTIRDLICAGPRAVRALRCPRCPDACPRRPRCRRAARDL
jgi:hypothetical protein